MCVCVCVRVGVGVGWFLLSYTWAAPQHPLCALQDAHSGNKDENKMLPDLKKKKTKKLKVLWDTDLKLQSMPQVLSFILIMMKFT